LIDVVKKFLPFIDWLEKSLATMKDSDDNPLVKGVKMTYDNFLAVLAWLMIFPIDTHIPLDSLLHEPIGTMPVTDEAQKWQIISCVQRWFVYRDNQTTKVIQTAKVIVGA
jgi:molecular chaperone GrpE (heat shock protein)